MKTINLTHNKVALVDDADYEELSQYDWYALKSGLYCYAARRRKNPDGRWQTIRMHRQIMKAPDGQHIDHVNHNGLDNRRLNLRFCTRSQNSANIQHGWGSSHYKGVTWYKRYHKWKAQIQCNGKKTHLGYFYNESKAARAYDTAALVFFGSFACLNFPTLSLPMPEIRALPTGHRLQLSPTRAGGS